jgi:hypothetical protein
VLVAYVSLDEVNQDLAATVADKYGATLASLASPAEMAACDAVVYDLDCLPSADRWHILAALICGPVKGVAAVHSYNLQPMQRRALRRKGVAVHRRLHSGWLSRLIRGKIGKAALTGGRRVCILPAG